jgi:anti-sigma B factor antagonist
VSSGHLPVDWHGPLAVVSMPEEIDMANNAGVADDLIATLDQDPAVLVVDMSQTTFCDSGGVRAVVLAHRKAAASGIELRLVITASAVRQVFSIIGAERLAAMHTDLASALTPVPGRPA